VSLGIVISIVVLAPVPLASATVFPYDTRTLAPVGPPVTGSTCDMFGCTHNLQVTFRNNANGTVTGIAYFVFRNAVGQTVYFDRADLSSPASQSATGTIPLNPAAKGNITMFVVSLGGVALSNSTAIHAQP